MTRARIVLTTALAIASAATLAQARQTAPPGGADAVRVLPVQGHVFMLVSAAGNITAHVGDDGVLLVDTGREPLAAQVAEAVRGLSYRPLHTIVNTSADPDRTGGAAALVRLLGGGPQAPRVLAQENVLTRLLAEGSKTAFPLNAVIALPVTGTYFTPSRDFFLNGEAVFLHHAPAAHTSGDTIVHFRGSDVISTGLVFTPDLYPIIDVANGGSVNGEIAALNRILDLTVPAKYQEGGTYVVPGRGRLSDEADVVEYRDMVTIVRDRVEHMLGDGMTLEQVKAARPTRDFDTEYGSTAGPWTNDLFVEAVYRSLSHGR
jgi:glyoxylase-like metal-dependent hydrolase (beta-lactamase superfamily II)